MQARFLGVINTLLHIHRCYFLFLDLTCFRDSGVTRTFNTCPIFIISKPCNYVDASSLCRWSQCIRFNHIMGVTKSFGGVVSCVSTIRYIRRQLFCIENFLRYVESSSFVRCPESRSVRFSEVALVLQLC